MLSLQINNVIKASLSFRGKKNQLNLPSHSSICQSSIGIKDIFIASLKSNMLRSLLFLHPLYLENTTGIFHCIVLQLLCIIKSRMLIFFSSHTKCIWNWAAFSNKWHLADFCHLGTRCDEIVTSVCTQTETPIFRWLSFCLSCLHCCYKEGWTSSLLLKDSTATQH